MLAFYPEQVNSRDSRVTVPGAPSAAADCVLLNGQSEYTPLHEAAINNRCEVAKSPDRCWSRPECQIRQGDSLWRPLAAADSMFLVDEQEGWTPLDWAKHYKSQDMVKLLEAAGAR